MALLLTPSEKLLLLESKCIPKAEADKIADVLKNKFRFSMNRPNGNLIATYVSKVEIDEDGKVRRNQEYIKRIAKILDNVNTELVAKEIEKSLQSTGVYEFKLPSKLLSKAKELAKAIIDNGFSFAEFIKWLDATKAYKDDAETIKDAAHINDRGLYMQLLAQANESVDESSLDGTTIVTKPEDDVSLFKEFEVLQGYLEDEYEAGVDYHIVASGDIRLQPNLVKNNSFVKKQLEKLGEYASSVNEADDDVTAANKWWRSLSINDWKALLAKHDKYYDKMESHKLGSPHNKKKYPDDNLILDMWKKEAVNEAKFTKSKADKILAYDSDTTVNQMVELIANHTNKDDLIDHIDGVTPIENEEGKWTAKDFLIKIGYINEAKMTIKRPYKRGGIELKPAVSVAGEAAIRDSIVKFIGSQPLFRASKSSIFEFFNTMNEDAEIGRTPSRSWLYRNTHLVKKIQIGKSTFYKLTRAGLNLFNKINKEVNEVVVNETVTTKTIEDKENQRKYTFYKTPSGKLEYRVQEWDDVDGKWDKGLVQTDIDWLFAEECPEINAYLEKEGYKEGQTNESHDDVVCSIELAKAYGVNMSQESYDELGPEIDRASFKEYYNIPEDADEDPSYKRDSDFNPKLLNKIVKEAKDSDGEEIDIDDTINDYLNEPSNLAKSIKNMPVNSKTEKILAKLDDLAREHGYLSEPMVFDALSFDEREYLKKLNESVHTSVLSNLLGNLNDLRDEIDATPEGETKILIPNYSINVQSKYDDGEDLQAEFDEIEKELGHTLIVNDYDDLVADPHGVLNESKESDQAVQDWFKSLSKVEQEELKANYEESTGKTLTRLTPDFFDFINVADTAMYSEAVEKGGMHKKLGIPDKDKISDHYKSGKALASHLLSANNGDVGKTSKELNYAANIGKNADPIFKEAASALKEMKN